MTFALFWSFINMNECKAVLMHCSLNYREDSWKRDSRVQFSSLFVHFTKVNRTLTLDIPSERRIRSPAPNKNPSCTPISFPTFKAHLLPSL
jgi:hypothetical protein